MTLGATRAVTLSLLVLSLFSPQAHAEGGLPDIRGEWAGAACPGETLSECEAHPEAPQNFVIETENFATGAVTGTGPGYTIKGTVSGNTFSVETLVGGTTSSSGTQTISTDVKKLAGYYKAGSTTGATFSTRLTPSPTESEAETITKKNLHASATGVSCYVPLVAAGAAWECTATVADASGSVPAGTPTGSVSFTINAGVSGGFPSGSTCSLQKSSSGPTSFCTVLFVPAVEVPIGAPAPITAHYSGDAHFDPSSSAPTSFVAREEPPLAMPSCKGGATAADVLLSPIATASATLPSPSREVLAGDPKRARKQRRLSRKAVGKRAIALLRPAKSSLASGVRLYALSRPLPAGSTISEARLGLAQPIVLPLALREPAWLVWEDLAPSARFEHPSIALLISAHGGRVLARSNFVTYPVIDTRSAPFLGSSSRRLLLFARAPGSRHPRRLSAAQLRLLGQARRQARAARKARRSGPAAKKADVAHSSLIMLVDHANKGGSETFENEEAAIGYTFAKHGVEVQGVTTVKALSSAVEEATARGQSNVTIYLDGHGLSANSAALPTVMLGPAEATAQGLAIPNGTVTSTDLTAIVRAHPDVKFNFIIDSCYSGRFVDPLKAEANVGTVMTSSTGTQKSEGPLELFTYKRTPETSKREAEEHREAIAEGTSEHSERGLVIPGQKPAEPAPAPVALTPSGKGIDGESNQSGEGISPFTTAVVAAVNQAFIGKDASADLTAVLADARTLEPSYDLAAALGKTSPSPEPTTETTGAFCRPPLPAEEASGGWFTKSGS